MVLHPIADAGVLGNRVARQKLSDLILRDAEFLTLLGDRERKRADILSSLRGKRRFGRGAAGDILYTGRVPDADGNRASSQCVTKVIAEVGSCPAGEEVPENNDQRLEQVTLPRPIASEN